MENAKLKELLQEKDMTVYRLAKGSGISAGNVYQIINGKRSLGNLSFVNAISMARVLDISLEELANRYTIFKDYLKAEEIPVVVLEQDLKQRMASTIQFNRARGVHQTEMMADLVKAAIAQGSSETDLTKHMGMDLEEVFRLEQQAGIAEQFKDYPWSKSWIIENLEEK